MKKKVEIGEKINMLNLLYNFIFSTLRSTGGVERVRLLKLLYILVLIYIKHRGGGGIFLGINKINNLQNGTPSIYIRSVENELIYLRLLYIFTQQPLLRNLLRKLRCASGPSPGDGKNQDWWGS